MFSRGRRIVALSLSQVMPEEVTTTRRSKRKRIPNRRLLFDQVWHFFVSCLSAILLVLTSWNKPVN